ncbi:MAG: HK97 family phage prohead protease [Deltaproteobacteria bacterium]|nr:HK97 family phage prohead protease [Deltaproteobacteria bacterium]
MEKNESKLTELLKAAAESEGPAPRLYKDIGVSIKEVDDASRTFTAVASTEDVDRDGDMIRADGWNLKEFKKNPVIPWGHNYSLPPVARAVKVWVDGKKLMVKIKFPQPETVGEFSFEDKIYRMYRDGFLNSFSVGFNADRFEHVERRANGRSRIGTDFIKQTLWEISAVTIPANPGATIERAKSEGILTDEDVEILTKWQQKPGTDSQFYIDSGIAGTTFKDVADAIEFLGNHELERDLDPEGDEDVEGKGEVIPIEAGTPHDLETDDEPFEIPNNVCETCGAPATGVAQDFLRAPGDDGYFKFAIDGDPHYFCEAHPYEGEITDVEYIDEKKALPGTSHRKPKEDGGTAAEVSPSADKPFETFRLFEESIKGLKDSINELSELIKSKSFSPEPVTSVEPDPDDVDEDDLTAALNEIKGESDPGISESELTGAINEAMEKMAEKIGSIIDEKIDYQLGRVDPSNLKFKRKKRGTNS